MRGLKATLTALLLLTEASCAQPAASDVLAPLTLHDAITAHDPALAAIITKFP